MYIHTVWDGLRVLIDSRTINFPACSHIYTYLSTYTIKLTHLYGWMRQHATQHSPEAYLVRPLHVIYHPNCAFWAKSITFCTVVEFFFVLINIGYIGPIHFCSKWPFFQDGRHTCYWVPSQYVTVTSIRPIYRYHWFIFEVVHDNSDKKKIHDIHMCMDIVINVTLWRPSWIKRPFWQ